MSRKRKAIKGHMMRKSRGSGGFPEGMEELIQLIGLVGGLYKNFQLLAKEINKHPDKSARNLMWFLVGTFALAQALESN